MSMPGVLLLCTNDAIGMFEDIELYLITWIFAFSTTQMPAAIGRCDKYDDFYHNRTIHSPCMLLYANSGKGTLTTLTYPSRALWSRFSNKFIVDLQYTGNDSFFDLQMPYLAGILTLLLLLIYFYIGQKIHMDLMSLRDAIYLTEWYGYPLKIQRYIHFMMLRSTQPFYLSAYGIMQLNLENFVGVSGYRDVGISKPLMRLFILRCWSGSILLSCCCVAWEILGIWVWCNSNERSVNVGYM